MTRHLRILSSDDDEGIRALLSSLLTEHGHEVEFAGNSDEVFKNLGRAKYDLLILDVNTPGLDGYKVAEKISGNITNKPKMLIFTARDLQEERSRFARSGADAIIRKGEPCDRIMNEIAALFPEAGPERIQNGQGPDAPMQNPPPQTPPAPKYEKFEKDLQHCVSKLTQIEELGATKNLRYEEFIRELLKEKQRTEKNYLEFKRIEEEVIKLKNWGYAVTAAAALAVIRSFFR